MKIKTRKQLKQEIEELKAEIERVNDVRWMLINRLDVTNQRINKAIEYVENDVINEKELIEILEGEE